MALRKSAVSGTLLALFACQAAFSADWLPLDPGQLALKTPVVEKDADAEVLVWDVRVEDKASGQDVQVVLQHYLRLKVFTEKGAKDLATVDVYLSGKRSVIDLAARTIQPDGTISELKKDAVFEREVLRAGRRFRVKAKSFALPNVTPGSILEYRYREVRDNELSNYMQFPFSREYPIHRVSYHIKPLQLPYLPFSMRGYPHLLPNKPFDQEREGFNGFTMTNVPAQREEPDMPPENFVQPWLMVYYADKFPKPEQFWKDQGKVEHKRLKDAAKVNNDIKRTAAELVSGLSNDEEKLAKLAAFCRAKVKNVFSQGSGVTPAQREAFKPNKSPADALKQGLGTGDDINMLFAALAMALDYDVRSIRVCDRSRNLFNPGFPDTVFLDSKSLAVKIGEQWKFYDPAGPYLPPGMLRWQEEGAAGLISDPKEGLLIDTPLSPPELSVRRRRADLVLSEDGTLEGKLELSYSGHASVDQKNIYDQDSPEKRDERIIEIYKNFLPDAVVTDLKVNDHIADASKPFSYTCRIKVPNYAQRTGKRLLFQPAFFQAGKAPRYRNSERRFDIYMDYPWTEDDEVHIQIPDGFNLDNASAPPSTSFGKAGEYKVGLSISNGLDRKLVYTRKLVFGGGGLIVFPKTSYPQVKKAFDFVNEQDNHMLSLKVAE